jgi:hypothetical protein
LDAFVFAATTHDGDMLTVVVAELVSLVAIVTLFANKLLISDDVVVGVVMSCADEVTAGDCVNVCWFVERTCWRSDGVCGVKK